MASWKDFFKSKTLSAKSLGKGKLIAKIEEVHPEELKGRDGSTNVRLCLKLEGKDELVALNKTNVMALDAAWGEDFAKWKGKKVKIETVPREYGGEPTRGLQITPMK